MVMRIMATLPNVEPHKTKIKICQTYFGFTQFYNWFAIKTWELCSNE